MNRSELPGQDVGPYRPFGSATLAGRRPVAVEPLENGHDDFDALRDLFLNGSPLGPVSVDAASPVRPAPVPAAVEGLVLGHLPVYGPAWVSQYARSLADEVGGAVGLIGLRAGQTTLDVYGPGSTGLAECRTLDEAVAAAAPVVARWLVRLDETSEPMMAESPRLTRITLLTGVDEAAVVACYRTLKRLVREDAEGAPVGPTVRLAVMGAGPERAGPAAEKLSRAAETFLGRRVEAAACLSRISPGRSVSVYRGQAEVGLDGVLDLIAGAPTRAAARAVLEVERPVAVVAAHVEASPFVVAPVMTVSVPAASIPAAPARPASEVVATKEPRVWSNGSAPRVISAPAPVGEASVGGDSLCTRIGGLQPLEARCPHAPGVELAFDSSGVLHLLAQAPEGAGQGSAEEVALAQLTACGAWASSHLSLLALTAPGARLLTSGTRPVLHLATRHAPAVRRLLDADVRIHLVATVEVEGKSGVVCVALN